MCNRLPVRLCGIVQFSTNCNKLYAEKKIYQTSLKAVRLSIAYSKYSIYRATVESLLQRKVTMSYTIGITIF